MSTRSDGSPLASMAPKKKPQIITRALMVFLGAMILANVGHQMNQQMMPLYVQSLGANVQQVGLFFTITSIMPLTFQILGGFISDSIGRLQAIAIGTIAGLIGYIMYVWAPNWQFMIVAQSIASVASCFVSPSFQAYVAEQSSEEMRARTFATVDSIYTVVGVIGPTLGGLISQRFGYRQMFAVSALLYAGAAVIRFAMAANARRESSIRAGSASGAMPERPTIAKLVQNMRAMVSLLLAGGVITWLFIADGVSDIAFTLGGRLEPLYYGNIIGMSNLQIGSLLSILNVTMMVMLPLGGWFADKAGERAGIAIGHLFFSTGYVLMLLSKGYAQFTVVWVLYGIGASLLSPAYNSLISKAVPEKMRGTAYGLFSTSLGLISLPAPYIGGLMWRTLGPRAPFMVPLVSSLVLAPLLWIKLGSAKGKANAAVTDEADAASAEADTGSKTDRHLAQLEDGPASADA